MKKKVLALVCAMVMVLGMGITAAAAPSVSTEGATESSSAGDTPSVPAESLATATQQFTLNTLNKFAATTTVTSSVNATISSVSDETAAAVIGQAKILVNENAFIASIVDLNVPAGTGAASYTLTCPNVWAGQKVYILHMKGDGTCEVITPDSVGNNVVTFTLSSYSPIAIVVDTTASKTADVSFVVALMGLFGLCGTAVLGRKRS